MKNQQADQDKRCPTPKDLWRLALAIIGVVAIVQELRKPPEERTWHGKVASFVPYDFRKPTVERFRQTYWNPEGPVIASKALGGGLGAQPRRCNKAIRRQCGHTATMSSRDARVARSIPALHR